METWIADAIFCFFALITVGGALVVAFSKNIVHSAFALLFTFSGVLGFYAFLGADFLAVIQLIVYIGGITVLFLFAIFLTKGVKDIRISNRVMGRVPAFLLVSGMGYIIAMVIWRTWHHASKLDPEKLAPTTEHLGKALLGPFLLPFELVSVMLVSVVIGAIVLARKEIRDLDNAEEEG